ncbi:MAG: hypothetical protein V7742_21625 [Halioglobus sp.]
MFDAFGLLMAGSLPATILFYAIGLLVIKRLRVTGLTQLVGLGVAVVFTAILALLMAEERTTNSALSEVNLAAILASIICVVGIAFIGKRKEPEKVEQ